MAEQETNDSGRRQGQLQPKWENSNSQPCAYGGSLINKKGLEGTRPGLRCYLLSDLVGRWLINSGKNKQQQQQRFQTQSWRFKIRQYQELGQWLRG